MFKCRLPIPPGYKSHCKPHKKIFLVLLLFTLVIFLFTFFLLKNHKIKQKNIVRVKYKIMLTQYTSKYINTPFNPLIFFPE